MLHQVFRNNNLFMPNTIVKNVLACLILVVLCIVIGAEAAEDSKSSVGIIIALVGICFMLWVGKRSWALIYLMPPLLSLIPLPGRFASIPLAYTIGSVVLVYWFVMWGMGYVKFRWRGLLLLDLVVFGLFFYMVASYVRHPVSMGVLGFETEYVGGKEYVFALTGTLFYLAISVIPCTYAQLVRVLTWTVKICIGMAVLFVFLAVTGVYGGGMDLEQLTDEATGSRFSLFSTLGAYGIYLVYGQYPFGRVLFSPRLLLYCFLSGVAILISGWREKMVSNAFVIVALSFIKRELWCMMLLLTGVYGVLLFLSHEEIVKEFPYGMQRCLTVLPGIEVSDEAGKSARHSSEWRIEMWRWALDPRTRYINDYVWGDGFGLSTDYLRRETIAAMRGKQGDIREQFVVTGVWHSGVITSIHRLGYVGLALITLVNVVAFCLMLRTCKALRGNSLYLPSLFFALPLIGEMAHFYISAGTIVKFYKSFVYIAMIKLLYCVAREQGLLIPWMRRQHYVPLVIQEHENRIRPSAL